MVHKRDPRLGNCHFWPEGFREEGRVSGPPKRVKTRRKGQKVRNQAARAPGVDSSDSSELKPASQMNCRLLTAESGKDRFLLFLPD